MAKACLKESKLPMPLEVETRVQAVPVSDFESGSGWVWTSILRIQGWQQPRPHRLPESMPLCLILAEIRRFRVQRDNISS